VHGRLPTYSGPGLLHREFYLISFLCLHKSFSFKITFEIRSCWLLRIPGFNAKLLNSMFVGLAMKLNMLIIHALLVSPEVNDLINRSLLLKPYQLLFNKASYKVG